MDRLTVPDVRVDEHTTRRSIIDGNAVREHAMEIYWRLKDYEDTGYTPEDIDKYEKALGAQFKSLTAMKNKYVAMRNELCQYCGKYKQAHNDACNGCKWRKV